MPDPAKVYLHPKVRSVFLLKKKKKDKGKSKNKLSIQGWRTSV
jgi:hypothetical protein